VITTKDLIKAVGKPINRSKAIRIYCHECAGGNNKEVTLCTVLNCPLWPWRFGCEMKSPLFSARMNLAQKNYPEEFEEAYSDAFSSPTLRVGSEPQKKSAKPLSDYLDDE
jgi:hypothetical protein